jgi:hypothetical protein
MSERDTKLQTLRKALEDGWAIEKLYRYSKHEYFIMLRPTDLVSDYLTKSELLKLGLDPELDGVEAEDDLVYCPKSSGRRSEMSEIPF